MPAWCSSRTCFTGAEKPAFPARGHGAEMRARRRQAQRPRQCRLHRAPPHLLRDARQFLLRRLLQGARHRARLGPAHQGLCARQEAPARSPSMPTTTRPARLWKKIAGFSDEKIIRIADLRQFLVDGRTGPCGPCSEIFYDHGASVAGGPPGSPDADGDRFVEILESRVHAVRAGRPRTSASTCPSPRSTPAWGLSASPPSCRASRQLRHRPVPRADRASVEPTGVAGQGRGQAAAPGHRRPSARVLLPHRRRRAAVERGPRLCAPPHHAPRHAPRASARRRGAAACTGWCRRWSPRWAHAYPELERGRALIVETLQLEETRFRDTLERGLRLLDEATRGSKRGEMLPGETAFKLYDTYGFPLDLTAGRAESPRHRRRHRGLRRMHGAPARRGAQGLGGLGRGRDRDRVVRAARARLAPPSSWATAPRPRPARSWRSCKDGKRVSSSKPASAVAVIVNQTPFYGESGGQVGDRGHDRARQARVQRRGHAEEAAATFSPFRCARSRHAEGRRGRSISRSIMHAAPRRAPTTPPPTCCTRRCARCSGRTWRRRARWSRPTACGSISPIRGR